MAKELQWYQKSVEATLKELGVGVEVGLSGDEVARRRERYGANDLPRGKKVHWWQLLGRQFVNPLIFILVVAAGITYALDEYIDSSVIVLSVLVNVAIGFWQEFQSNRIFETLQGVVRVTARVRRGGKMREVDMAELVPGDVILLHGDMKVPADARVLSAKNLLLNESLLTGESRAVSKSAQALEGEKPLGDRKSMVHMGTLVERGEGEAVVVETGVTTEIGKIAALTTGVEDEMTPLQERLSRLGKMIGVFVLFSSLAIFAAGFFDPTRTALEMFTVAVAVAVAAIPEGLPAALSVILAVSASRILEKNGLIKKLVAAETLGSTTVIVTDKTGTITEGTMEVKELIDAPDTHAAARALALSSNVLITKNDDGTDSIKGDSTDKAKVEYGLSLGLTLDALLSDMPRVAFLPFDEQKKCIVSFHRGKSGNELFISGAPEVLLAASKIPPKKQQEILSRIEDYAAKGFRMVGAARRSIADEIDSATDEKNLHQYIGDLEFLGVAAIHDPIRKDVFEAMRVTREAGVRVIMATGDHRLTAESIGRELGFNVSTNAIITGEEIDALSPTELKERVDEIEIVARVSPAHKMRIVEALKEDGEVVSMTGDGINDAPALRAADIGVAIGSGTDVTKETADLVLIDDSFSTITEAIRQGRIAFDNIRKVVIFLLSNSFTELLMVSASLIFHIPLPITAVQILWANLVEDGLPNFALAFEPGEEDIMRRKPLKRNEAILDKPGKVLVFFVGIITDLILVGIFLYLYYFTSFSLPYIQTFIFAALSTDSLLYVFSLKDMHRSLFKTNLFNNHYLIIAVVAGFAITFAAIYATPLNTLLGTVPLHGGMLIFLLALGILEVALVEATKWWMRERLIVALA